MSMPDEGNVLTREQILARMCNIVTEIPKLKDLTGEQRKTWAEEAKTTTDSVNKLSEEDRVWLKEHFEKWSKMKAAFNPLRFTK